MNICGRRTNEGRNSCSVLNNGYYSFDKLDVPQLHSSANLHLPYSGDLTTTAANGVNADNDDDDDRVSSLS
ncbi:unnamed protein product [Gongylonema pulchrum]|uniref:Uncharacterized protein n=1 Tax=Gongylonema pulchrum TaxID=637853 RepID=A0A183DNT1_9BILA|nr:unnamed protein product [Gongylonema pulchrum]